MFMKSRRQASKKGFTLTEAAIVLGIVGLILGAIWVAAGSVYRNMRVATTTDQMLQIVQAVRSLHATQPSVDSALTAVNLAKAGGVPKDMLDDVTNPANVRNVWGGMVTVEQDSGNATYFVVTFNGVPSDACADLLTRNTGSGRDTGLITVKINDTPPSGGMPVTVSNAVAACNANPSSMAFTYALRS